MTSSSSSSRAKTVIAKGEVIAGKYRLVGELGEGGMGFVWMADAALGKVAIKFLNAPGFRGEEAKKRFFREAQALRSIQSKHAVKVFDLGHLDDQIPFIVMEFLDGCDLDVLLDERERVSVGEAAQFVRDVCDALSEAHEIGIVHRDLKPKNLFLMKDNRGRHFVKVLDFGIAKVPVQENSLKLTSQPFGTIAYMAPEQINSMSDVDGRADIWSLGVILYELVTGEKPFYGETMVKTADKIRSETPRPPSALQPVIPPAFDRVVMKCLERDLTRRYQTVDELVGDLNAIVAPGARPSQPESPAATQSTAPPQPTAPTTKMLGSRRTPVFTQVLQDTRSPPLPESAPPVRVPQRMLSARTILMSSLLLLVLGCTVALAWGLSRPAEPRGNPTADTAEALVTASASRTEIPPVMTGTNAKEPPVGTATVAVPATATTVSPPSRPPPPKVDAPAKGAPSSSAAKSTSTISPSATPSASTTSVAPSIPNGSGTFKTRDPDGPGVE